MLVNRCALGRILNNLLSNAIKFSPAGSTIRVRASATDSTYCVQVQDQGPGVTEADLTQIFKPFVRGSASPTSGESSTGLGLAMTHSLAARLGGQLTAYTDGGAVFEVTLPRVPPTPHGLGASVAG